nr:uncharacterized protein LOC123756175 [Procambarus clarkii]
MPVSPYYGQSGYVNRTYTRNTSSYIPLIDSKFSFADTRGTGNFLDESPANYFRSKYIIPEDTPALSYLAPTYTPASRSGYQLAKYSSTDNVPQVRSPTENNRLHKSPSTSSFLAGNTASLQKTFLPPPHTSSSTLYTASRPKYSDHSLNLPKVATPGDYTPPVERKYAGKCGTQSSYANQYLARINKARDVRPREIDTRDINTTDKPQNAKWYKADAARDDDGISRNRQVVRLTIKREKNDVQDPFIIKNKTLNTIAQRLLEKYQVNEKKRDPYANQPTRKLHQDQLRDEPQASKSRPPLPHPPASVSKPLKTPTLPDPQPCKPLPNDHPEEHATPQNVPNNSNAERENYAAKILQRAATTAETKKELESWAEVKDAIYAAVLRPDVDIESDEEMEKLIQGEADSSTSSASSTKDRDDRESATPANDVGKGQAIIGQLKRFVKQQESVKGTSKKRSSAKECRSSKRSKKSKCKRSNADNAYIIEDSDKKTETVSLLTTDLLTEDLKLSANKEMGKTSFISPEMNTPKAGAEGREDKDDASKIQNNKEKKLNEGAATRDVTQTIASWNTTNLARNTEQDNTSLLSADLVLTNAISPENKKKTKPKNLATTGAVEPTTQTRDVEGSSGFTTPVHDKVIPLIKASKRDNTSLLSADLVLSNLSSGIKKEDIYPPEIDQTQAGKRNTEIKEKRQQLPKDNWDQIDEKININLDRKVKTSQLPEELFSKPTTSTGNKEITLPTNQTENRKLEDGYLSIAAKAVDAAKETPSTRIPKIKMKMKTQTTVVDQSPEAPQLRASPAAPPSPPPLQKASNAQVKVSTSQDVQDFDACSEENKERRNKTPATWSVIETPKQQPETAAEAKKTISRKETGYLGSEASSILKKKESISTSGTTSGISVELGTNKIPEASLSSPSHKDEAAAKEEGFKDIQVAIDSFLESSPKVSSSSEAGEMVPSEREIIQVKGQPSDSRQDGNKIPKDIFFTKTHPDELQDRRVEEKTDATSTSKPSAIPWRQNGRIQLEEKPKNQITLKEEDKIINKAKLERGTEEKYQSVENPKEVREKEGNESTMKKAEQTLRVSQVQEVGEKPVETLAAKKALKRPRQIVPPAAPDKSIGNELLKVRNILKRPVKQNAITPVESEKQQQTNASAPTEPSVRFWKKEIAQLVPPNQGNQFLQARNFLKKPIKSNEDKTDKKEVIVQDVKTKKFVKKVVQNGEVGAASEVGLEPRGRALRRQRCTHSRSSSSSSSSSSDDSSTVRKKGEKPKRLIKPKSSGAGKSPSPKVSSPVSQREGPDFESDLHHAISQRNSLSNTNIVGSTEQEPKLNAIQSTDSGYGSTPSTPQPPATVPDAKDSGYGSSPTTPQPTPTVPEVKDEERCAVCGTNCHKKCEKQMPNLCGVNQKLLAEALSSVKKGGSGDGTSRTLASSTKTCSSSVSGSEAETTEDETETTDTDSGDYFGLPEIRPPLQTCPKFKKYTVSDFDFIKVLGKGSYGKVMLAQQKDSENYFAVKCLKKDVVLEDNDVECTLIERKVLSLGTKHPYLCHLFCTFQTPSHLFFVMEYLTGGDLMFHIQHCGRFDEFRACFYAAEITSGLKFLHSKGIIYRDLKLDNILLDYQGHIRIADFGMCKLQVYLDRYADTFCGTPDYMAPEVIKGLHYNQCVDWWSFGVLLYEMLTGKSPFKGCDEDHLFWLICNDEPFYPKFLSKEATNILKQLLDKDSSKRLGIPFSPYGEIMDQPFFKYIDWNKIERKEVETPYKPRLRHILDVQYFDPLFTKRQAAITPLDESILATMDQAAFRDFSYTNPNITD